MKESEARAVVGLVASYWPHQSLPDEAEKAWGAAFETQSFTFEDATLGIRALAITTARCPALSVIVAAAHAERKRRQEHEVALDGDQDFPMMSDLFPNVEKPA